MPGTPEKLDVSQVVLHEDIRQSVSGQLTRQAAWIGGFLLVLTVLLIANSMIVSVTARTTEIGIRRALGASRSAVAGVFWFEGGLVGALGGLAGAGISTGFSGDEIVNGSAPVCSEAELLFLKLFQEQISRMLVGISDNGSAIFPRTWLR